QGLPKCYKCGKSGHVRAECPNKGQSREKAYAVAWSGSEDESEYDESEIQGYMAFANRDDGSSSSRSLGDELHYIPTEDPVADLLTKSFTTSLHWFLTSKLML
ncbi:unnamed protein product, partial [Linum tenue]